ncbi:phage integrase family domain protein [Streptomyces himastatinicus ATCC 53653]|uniref:Phage integrase family domain protein n=1 Tax=Streptomyces himastatinicus ATCC 53653 TaxID=457427 RepID=D9WB43_9ACTN|nr:phage integrase family domain protein [Streptomyces himastatinicus ATCC 53653]
MGPATAPWWPTDDILILRNRPVRIGTPPSRMSRFGDEVWYVQPAHRDAHLQIPAISWPTFPAAFRQHFRTFFLAALDHPVPVEPGGRQRPAEQASVGSFPYWVIDMRVLACWLEKQGFRNLSEVRDADLETFRTYVLGLDRTARRKSDLISAVRLLWLFNEHMPAPCRLDCDFPWPGQTAKEVVGAPAGTGRENKIPRIADATMEALLAWALVMIEEIGPDIRDAWHEYQQLEAGNHHSQARYSGTRIERLQRYIAHCQRQGVALPGHADGSMNQGHIKRLIGIPKGLRQEMSAPMLHVIASSGLPVVPFTGVGQITGQVHGRPWREHPITVEELPTLVRLLSAALFTTVCYLSGMRPGEVLNLRRGCRDTDETTGELLVHGFRGKGYDRVPDKPDVSEPLRPWVVVDVVHAAIALLEELHDLPLLFPASLTNAHTTRPAASNARKGRAMNDDIQDLIAWINSAYLRADGRTPIPTDPAGRINAARYRRTLARFIVRKPRGLIAAALQYGHVHTKVTLSYAGYADPSWLYDVAVEKLELIIDQVEQDSERLAAGEHVSGPAADEYRARVERTASFAGRVVTSAGNAERLLEQTDPAIYHGQGMTCVWRAAAAACRKAKLALGLPDDDAPDESECRSSCTNLAYTDRDIADVERRLEVHRAQAADPLAPKPRRDRAEAQAEQLSQIIDRHRGHHGVTDAGKGTT